jgi:hypothetical protein
MHIKQTGHINKEISNAVKLLPFKGAIPDLGNRMALTSELKKNLPSFYTKPIHRAKKYDLL